MDKSYKKQSFWLILKQGSFSLLYTVIMCPLGLLIMMIPDNYNYFTVLCGILTIALFVTLNFFFYRSIGSEQMKTLNSNQVLYENKDKLTEGTRIEKEKEFSKYKGLLYGLVSVAPLILLLFIYAICDIAGLPLTKMVPEIKENGETVLKEISTSFGSFGGAIKFIYSMYWCVFSPISAIKGNPMLTDHSIYFLLFAIPIAMLATFIPYMIGGLKAKRELNAMKETNAYIYGGKEVANPALEKERDERARGVYHKYDKKKKGRRK